MNIIFCRYKNLCEPDYIDAFKALGIDVVEVFINELGTQRLEEKTQLLAEIIVKSKPMFVFSINFFPYISIVCQGLSIKYVSVSVTCPMVEIYNTTVRNDCNRIFLFDKEQYLSVCEENPKWIFYLPLGAGVERMDRAIENISYKYDVSFVGSLYNEKDPFLKLALEDSDKQRYESLMLEQMEKTSCGQDYLESNITDEDVSWIKELATDFYPSDLSVRNLDRFVAINNYLSPHMTYLERVKILNLLAADEDIKVHLFTNSNTETLENVICHGGVETLTAMPQVFFQSRINLNLSTRSIKTGIPQRVWDVLGSRGFLLTNYQEELPEYFEIGKHLVAYENLSELKELVKYYLSHEDERKEIARAGYELVKEKGSVLGRVVSMIKCLN